jgi:micrococcal nuclease
LLKHGATPQSHPGRRRAGAAVLVVILVAIVLGDRLDSGQDRSGGGAGEATGAGDRVSAEVLRVVDGDTIEVDFDGRTEDVRYIGVDTPESVKPGSPVECFGKQASEFNRELVEDEQVTLVFDRELRDAYGRLLAYVYVGREFVNAELVRRGFARTLEIAPNTARAGALSRLERSASIAGRGLWGSC